MTKHRPTFKNKLNLVSAIFLLSIALILTLTGVARFHILVYAAAPCYFLSFVLFHAAQTQRSARPATADRTNTTYWF